MNGRYWVTEPVREVARQWKFRKRADCTDQLLVHQKSWDADEMDDRRVNVYRKII